MVDDPASCYACPVSDQVYTVRAAITTIESSFHTFTKSSHSAVAEIHLGKEEVHVPLHVHDLALHVTEISGTIVIRGEPFDGLLGTFCCQLAGGIQDADSGGGEITHCSAASIAR